MLPELPSVVQYNTHVSHQIAVCIQHRCLATKCKLQDAADHSSHRESSQRFERNFKLGTDHGRSQLLGSFNSYFTWISVLVPLICRALRSASDRNNAPHKNNRDPTIVPFCLIGCYFWCVRFRRSRNACAAVRHRADVLRRITRVCTQCIRLQIHRLPFLHGDTSVLFWGLSNSSSFTKWNREFDASL